MAAPGGGRTGILRRTCRYGHPFRRRHRPLRGRLPSIHGGSAMGRLAHEVPTRLAGEVRWHHRPGGVPPDLHHRHSGGGGRPPGHGQLLPRCPPGHRPIMVDEPSTGIRRVLGGAVRAVLHQLLRVVHATWDALRSPRHTSVQLRNTALVHPAFQPGTQHHPPHLTNHHHHGVQRRSHQ